jgi:hypothetical protein
VVASSSHSEKTRDDEDQNASGMDVKKSGQGSQGVDGGEVAEKDSHTKRAIRVGRIERLWRKLRKSST